MPEPGTLDRVSLAATHWFWQAVDWIYPPACISCGKEGERWCQECRDRVERVGARVCSRCGKRISTTILCGECKERTPAYTALRSFGLYRDPLRLAILHLKYRRDLGLGEILAGMLVRLVKEQTWQPELVIPVPLSPAKRFERGYNQVDLFARPLAWSLGRPYAGDILQRVRENISQVKLSAENRRRNVSQAFEMGDRQLIDGRRILLVDDVATTGSTVDACSRLLLKGGAVEVFVATLARSQLRKPKEEVFEISSEIR